MIDSTMTTARDALTPDALALLQAVAQAGSFAAAARELGLVPSAVTYRIRQIEDALDVLLFDRSSRQARLTPAGTELLREGGRLLAEIDAVANRVKRVATGWESQLTIAVDTVISAPSSWNWCEAFYALAPVTRLRLRDESLSGTLEALTSGQADLALGVALEPGTAPGIQSSVLGEIAFVYAVAPHHPLAAAPGTAGRRAAAASTAPSPWPIRCSAARRSRSGCWRGRTCSRCRPCGPSSMRSCAAWAAASCPSRWRGPTSKAAAWWSRRSSAARRAGARSVMPGAASASPGRALQWWLAQLESAHDAPAR